MNNPVTNIKDLAHILNLSVTTISRVLNGKAEKFRISKATQKRVIEAAVNYNYVANKLARGLKMEKTDTLGLIVPDISNPFFTGIAHGIETEARNNGYSLILCDSRDDNIIEINLISLLLSHRVEGIIIAPAGLKFDYISNVYNNGTPIVLVDRCPSDGHIPSVSSDNFQATLDAVEYIISMGHERIACIQGVPNIQTNIDRVIGYKEALKRKSIELNPSLIVGDYHSVENGYNQTHILFSLLKPPTAIIALSNQIALGVIRAVNERGMKIGRDVSLVSFDEQPYSPYLDPPMTTISQKKTEMGQLAVGLLLKRIQNENYKNENFNLKLRTDLIIRGSVRPPAS